MNLEPVAFVHIPRTAGMSLGAVLENTYKCTEIYDFYVDKNENVATQRIADFVGLPAEVKNRYRLIKGHFKYGFDSHFDSARYITFLRDPVARLVSYYFYALAMENHYLNQWLVRERITLDAFLTSGMSIELDNYQVRMISGYEFADRADKVNSEHMAMAKQNLETKFAAFGITEQFDLSVYYLSRVMRWPAPYYRRRNVAENKFGFSGLKGETLEKVMVQNRYDMELYEYAVQLFERRIAAENDEFHRGYRTFLKRNQRLQGETSGFRSKLLQFIYRRLRGL